MYDTSGMCNIMSYVILCFFCEAMCETSGDLVRRFGLYAAALRVRSVREH